MEGRDSGQLALWATEKAVSGNNCAKCGIVISAVRGKIDRERHSLDGMVRATFTVERQ